MLTKVITLPRSDADIRADVEQALTPPVRVHPSGVLVEVRDGVVRLTGWLKDKDDIASAVAEARMVDGVVAVDPRLELRGA